MELLLTPLWDPPTLRHNETWFVAMRTIAEALEAQQKMQEELCERMTKDPDRSRVLTTITLPEFDGDPKPSVRKYRDRKKIWRSSRS